jgi:type IV secretory pathway VirB10-like protein
MLKKFLISAAILAVLSLLVSLVTFADVYTWRDKDGKIHVTETKPPADAEIIKSIIHPTPTETPKGYIKPTPKPRVPQNDQPTPKPTQASEEDTSSDEDASLTPTPLVDKDGHNEAWWRKKKQNLEQSLASSQNRLKEVENQLYYVNEEALYDNPKQREKLLNEKDSLEKKVAELNKELDDLEYTCRQAGGLPGWVRD